MVIFDNFSSGHLSHIQEKSNDPRVTIVTADLKDVSAVTSAMSGCDTVFHLAANPDIAKAVNQPDIDFWEGTYLTQNVLEAMRANEIRENLIHVKQRSIWGKSKRCFHRRLRSVPTDLDLWREQTRL